MKYRKKPVVIEATQWFKNGDHPQDACETFYDSLEIPFKGEGRVVRYYRRPDDSGDRVCDQCGRPMQYHGWIDTLEGGHVVCPGDFIITGVKGEHYPCKPDIFAETYEDADADNRAPVEGHIRDLLLGWLYCRNPFLIQPHEAGIAYFLLQKYYRLPDGEAALSRLYTEIELTKAEVHRGT